MTEQSKADRIAEVQGNLPLPEEPPVAPDWNSLDARNVNVGSGEQQAEIPSGRDDLTEPQTKSSGVREEGGKNVGQPTK